MSGAPWPSVRDYIAWAQSWGCAVAIRDIEREGQIVHAVSLRAPSGAVAHEIAMELSDPLISTTIARLDRRLGRKSHLFR